MDNQELLQAMSQMIDSKLSEQLEPIKQDLSGVKQDLSEVKTKVSKIEVTLENDIASKMNALYEGYQLNSITLSNLQSSVDDMAPTVTALDILHQMQKDIKKR